MDFVEELKTEIYKNKNDVSFPILGNEFTENLWKRIDKLYALAKYEHVFYYNVLNNSKCIITNQRIIIDKSERIITVFWKDIKKITVKNDELIIESFLTEKILKIYSSEIDKLDFPRLKKLTVIFNNYSKFNQEVVSSDLERKLIASKFNFSKSTAINIPTEANFDEIYFNFEVDSQTFKYNDELNKIKRFIGLENYKLSFDLSYKIIKKYLDDEDMFGGPYSDNSSIVVLVSFFFESLLKLARNGDILYKDESLINTKKETYFYLKNYNSELLDLAEYCNNLLNSNNSLFENSEYLEELLVRNRFFNRIDLRKIDIKSLNLNSFRILAHEIVKTTEIILGKISNVLDLYSSLEVFYGSDNNFFIRRDLILKDIKNGNLLNSSLIDLYEIYNENLCHSDYNALPKSKKQFLGVFDTLVGRYNTSIICFDLSYIPGFLKFPHGHPQVDTLYVQHTTKANVYLPFESANEILLNEKIDEFIRVMQCLGATEINLEELDALDSNQRNNRKVDVSVEGNTKVLEGKGELNIDNANDEKFSSMYKKNLKLIFEPIKRPYLPNDLYWFHIDSKWRSLADMRLDGNTLHYEEYLLSEEVSSTSKDLNIRAKLQFHTLLYKGEGRTDVSRNSVTETKQDKVWKIRVNFKDIRELISD